MTTHTPSLPRPINGWATGSGPAGVLCRRLTSALNELIGEVVLRK